MTALLFAACIDERRPQAKNNTQDAESKTMKQTSAQFKTPGAILYIRVSTEEQAPSGTSPDVQRQVCLALAAQMGLPVVDIVPDLGVSGVRYSSRPGIQAALKAIEAGEASVLIATKVDRIGRSAAVILDIARRVRQAGGQLVTQDARFDDTSMGQFTLTMFAGMAELERNSIRDRTNSGRLRRAQEGIQPQRSRSPFGLHVITKKDKTLGLYPEAAAGTYLLTDDAPTVVAMFSRYQCGQSLREVCRWLNETGVIRQFGGKYWRPSQLKQVLVNPAYIGEATYGKRGGIVEEVGEKTIMHRTFRDTFCSIDAPAIISREMFEAVQQRLGEARAVFGGNPTRRHLLGGLLRCPLCGRGMHGTKRQKRTHGGRSVQEVHIYNCPDSRASRNAGGAVCNKKAYKGQEAEQVVLNAVKDLAARHELIPLALAAYKEKSLVAFDPQEESRIETALRALDDKERTTVDAQVAGIEAGASPLAYRFAFEKIAEQRAALLARRKELCASAAFQAGQTQADEGALLTQALVDVERVLSSSKLTDGQKHDILALVIERIIPEGENENGEGTYRLELRGLDNVEKGHSVSMLWPPAAATSSARFTCSWPLTSQKSKSSPLGRCSSDSGSADSGTCDSKSFNSTTTSDNERTA